MQLGKRHLGELLGTEFIGEDVVEPEASEVRNCFDHFAKPAAFECLFGPAFGHSRSLKESVHESVVALLYHLPHHRLWSYPLVLEEQVAA